MLEGYRRGKLQKIAIQERCHNALCYRLKLIKSRNQSKVLRLQHFQLVSTILKDTCTKRSSQRVDSRELAGIWGTSESYTQQVN